MRKISLTIATAGASGHGIYDKLFRESEGNRFFIPVKERDMVSIMAIETAPEYADAPDDVLSTGFSFLHVADKNTGIPLSGSAGVKDMVRPHIDAALDKIDFPGEPGSDIVILTGALSGGTTSSALPALLQKALDSKRKVVMLLTVDSLADKQKRLNAAMALKEIMDITKKYDVLVPLRLIDVGEDTGENVGVYNRTNNIICDFITTLHKIVTSKGVKPDDSDIMELINPTFYGKGTDNTLKKVTGVTFLGNNLADLVKNGSDLYDTAIIILNDTEPLTAVTKGIVTNLFVSTMGSAPSIENALVLATSSKAVESKVKELMTRLSLGDVVSKGSTDIISAGLEEAFDDMPVLPGRF